MPCVCLIGVLRQQFLANLQAQGNSFRGCGKCVGKFGVKSRAQKPERAARVDGLECDEEVLPRFGVRGQIVPTDLPLIQRYA